jgi:hypothetical protein
MQLVVQSKKPQTWGGSQRQTRHQCGIARGTTSSLTRSYGGRWSLPSQTLTLMSMIFVVALSSLLDVVAIELELDHPLDYNYE